MARLYLVRHATHDLIGKALAGRMPGVHLNAEGAAQARTLVDVFRDRPVQRILSSPMERCVETAAPLAAARGLTPAIHDDLVELHCGEWTNKPFEELAEDPRWARWNAARGASATPGGESTLAVQARIAAAMARLAEEEPGPTVFVTHSDVIKVAVQTLLGMSLDHCDRLEVDPASVTTVDLWRGGGKVVRLNAVAAP